MRTYELYGEMIFIIGNGNDFLLWVFCQKQGFIEQSDQCKNNMYLVAIYVLVSHQQITHQ